MSEIGLFESQVQRFENVIFNPFAGITDPKGIHHEFSQGLHGIKVDFDNITRGTNLYQMWIDLNTGFHRLIYSPEELGRAVIIGVANGTNDVARDTAKELRCGIRALETKKNSRSRPELTEEGIDDLQAIDPELAIINEDVLTRGTNARSVVDSVLDNRNPSLKRVEVVATLERGIPERLEVIGIVYNALIVNHQLDYTAEECLSNPKGYCARDWKLVPRNAEV